jgi:DNA-binding NtrC family response regulator
VATGRFRLDMFYRLDVFNLTVPPLRQRREDIPQLAYWLLERIAQRMARVPPSLSPEAERMIVAYDYPGNVRELRNILERALILDSGSQIGPGSLVLGRIAGPPAGDAPPFFTAQLHAGRPPTLFELEKLYVERLLEHAGGNRAQVARLLDVSYPTVAKKIADYGITIPEAKL